jgi:hypothetical protein
LQSNRLLCAALLCAGLRAQLLLPPLVATPSTIAADSDATKVTITGYGFTDNLTVLWNGQPRQTQFIGPGILQVTLTSDDLALPSVGTLAVWDLARQTPVSDIVSILVYLSIQNNDIVYDSLRNRIYVAVSKQQVPRGPSIAVLNPDTARIESWFPVDAEPEKLAISADARYLYAALGNLVRRIDLVTWTADLDIPLGSDQFFGARHVLTMVTLPQTSTSLAVSFRIPNLSPSYVGTAVFDGAKMRSNLTPGHDGPANLIGGLSDSALYAADGEGTFYTLKLDASGVTVANRNPYLCGLDGDPVLSGGLIYTGWGAAIDPAGPSLVTTFGAAGVIRPIPELQEVLILGSTSPPGYVGFNQLSLNLIDAISGIRIWSLPLPAHFDRNHGPLLRWGVNGVAFRDYYDFSASPHLYLFKVNLTRSGGPLP